MKIFNKRNNLKYSDLNKILEKIDYLKDLIFYNFRNKEFSIRDIKKLQNSFLEINDLVLIYINSLTIKTENKEFLELHEGEKKEIENILIYLRELFLRDFLGFYNNFFEQKKKIINSFLILKRYLENLRNLYKDSKNYVYDINYLAYDQIKFEDLEIGDVILEIKKDDIIKSKFRYKLIYEVTNSHIVHSCLFYGKKGKRYLFFDTDYEEGENPFKAKFTLLEKRLKNGEILLVLRFKKRLNKEFKKKIQFFMEKNIGKRYGIFRALNLALNIEKLKIFDSIKKLENTLEKEKYYCSEMVIRAYDYLGFNISPKIDLGTITPVDLLNLKEFEIIGFISKDT